MDTLKNKAIIYDDNCPMCRLYTNGFVKWGLLEKNNRVSFSELEQSQLLSKLNLHRAKHEIPLVDLAGKETVYGLDALLLILNQKLPLLVKIVRTKPLYNFFRHLYNLVSYNRRVIIPAKTATTASTIDCTPDFNLTYRIAWIGFALIASIGITYWFGNALSYYLNMGNGGYKMLLVAGSGWLVQILAAILFAQKKIDYIGHLSVVMLIGVLILVPAIYLSAITGYQYLVIPTIGVLLSSMAMLWQHRLRASHLEMSQWWTASWFFFLQSTAIVWVYIFYLNN